MSKCQFAIIIISHGGCFFEEKTKSHHLQNNASYKKEPLAFLGILRVYSDIKISTFEAKYFSTLWLTQFHGDKKEK